MPVAADVPGIERETCIKCKRLLPASDFSPSVLKYRMSIRCRECVQKNKKRRRDEARGILSCGRCEKEIVYGNHRRLYCSQVCARRAVVLRAHGLPPHADLEMIAAQNGKCDGCSGELGDDWSRITVDHCHDSGRVRSLLCMPCNSALGMTREDPDRLLDLAAYSLRHNFDLRDLCEVS